MPRATIYVYDNNSQDNTAHKSLENGTVLTKELRQGKGNVVRNMFRNIDADIYILVDGDDTYPAEYVHELIKPILDREVDNEK